MEIKGFLAATKDGNTKGYSLVRDAYPQEKWITINSPQSLLFDAMEHGEAYEAPIFMHDSLYCEWAYITDWDEATVDVYHGFNKRTPSAGIFKGRSVDGIWQACDKIISITFDEITEIPYSLIKNQIDSIVSKRLTKNYYK